jgi:hypothetical protein
MGAIQRGLRTRVDYRRRQFRLKAIRRGLLGGEPQWIAVLAGFALVAVANKALKRGPMPVLFSERLEPGQSFLVTHYERGTEPRTK